MDGNATVGGKFQMRDTGQICGFWSDSQSDNNGMFLEPYPYLDVSFIARPIIEWLVNCGSKLNQYPVDFDIICFNVKNMEIERQGFSNNDKPLIDIKFVVVPIGVTRIRIEIHKWNKPNCKAKILSFYTMLEEEYLGADIRQFEVLQELTEQTDNVTYGISSDTATISIYNRDRKFDRGYLKELVLLDRKVIPYIGIDKNNSIEYTQLGEFYSDEWKVPQDDNFAKVVCVDKLMRLQDVIYHGFALKENASLYEMIDDVLINSGYKSTQYNVDETAKEMICKNAYLTKGSSWDALQEITSSRLLKAYIDKQGILQVSAGNSAKKYANKITSKHIIKYNKSDKMQSLQTRLMYHILLS